MATQDQIIEALRPVQDPELHRSIVDLGMVRDVTIEGEKVTVLVALTVPGCPMKDEIQHRVTAAVLPVDGVEDVKVELTVMSPDELAELKRGFDGGGHAGHSHGSMPSQFATSATRVIAVTSGKGGVGKSTVAVNLAVALAKTGANVGLLDADVYGFSVPDMLGIDEEPGLVDEMIVPPVRHGVACMSIAYFVEPGKPVMWRGPMLHKAVEQFLTDVKWGELDFLIVDTPPGTGDVAMSIAKQLPRAETVVVTTPQPAAQTVAARTGAMANEIGSPVLGVVENMSWFQDASGARVELFGSGGGDELAAGLDTGVLARIPLVQAIREGGDSGDPVAAAGNENAAVFDQLAKTINETSKRRVYREELRVR